MTDYKPLIDAIEHWLATRKNTSLGLLSKLSNVGYSTVRRIVQNETAPTFQNAVQIASVVLPSDKAALLIDAIFADTTQILKSMFNQKKNVELIQPDSSKRAFLSSVDYFVFALTHKQSGITRDEVNDRAGLLGDKSLSRLLEHGIVKENNARFFLSSDSIAFSDSDTILAQIGFIPDLFEMDQVGKSAQLAWTAIEGLNEQGLGELNGVLDKAIKDIRSILIKKENQGDIPLALALISARI